MESQESLSEVVEERSAANPNYSGKEAMEHLENLSGDVKELIQKESIDVGAKVNDLKFQYNKEAHYI